MLIASSTPLKSDLHLEKVADKLKTEKANFQEELSQLSITLSNPSDTISKTAEMVIKNQLFMGFQRVQ